jgi:glycosyltransferase involved in cell wall biosynthesis
MRILFLSNYYPPYVLGGYELTCYEVAEQLKLRGHEIEVLTTRLPDKPNPSYILPSGTTGTVRVHRFLHLEVESGCIHTAIRLLTSRKRLEQESIRRLDDLYLTFKPDITMVWGSYNLPRSVLAHLEQLQPDRILYYFCDYWPTLSNAYLIQLKNPPSNSYNSFTKRLLAKPFIYWLERKSTPQLQFKHTICVSKALYRALTRSGVIKGPTSIIYRGIRIKDYLVVSRFKPRKIYDKRRMQLIYAGRLTPEKGIHTAIQALCRISTHDVSVTLDIFGRGDQRYEGELERLVKQHRLSSQVFFRGIVHYQEMPVTLSQYDALLFPSEWEEPFASIVLEAMAVGLPVIGTNTGGTGEVLFDGETGLVFPSGDADALAIQVVRLHYDTVLKLKLSENSMRLVSNGFSLDHMVIQIEDCLRNIID